MKNKKIIINSLIIILVIIIFYIVLVNIQRTKAPSQQVPIKVALEPELVKKIQNLETGVSFSGIVKEINNGVFNLDVLWFEPLKGEINSFSTKLTIDSKDEIVKYEKTKDNLVREVKASLKDIKVNSFINVLVKDNKKIITIITPGQ